MGVGGVGGGGGAGRSSGASRSSDAGRSNASGASRDAASGAKDAASGASSVGKASAGSQAQQAADAQATEAQKAQEAQQAQEARAREVQAAMDTARHASSFDGTASSAAGVTGAAEAKAAPAAETGPQVSGLATGLSNATTPATENPVDAAADTQVPGQEFAAADMNATASNKHRMGNPTKVGPQRAFGQQAPKGWNRGISLGGPKGAAVGEGTNLGGTAAAYDATRETKVGETTTKSSTQVGYAEATAQSQTLTDGTVASARAGFGVARHSSSVTGPDGRASTREREFMNAEASAQYTRGPASVSAGVHADFTVGRVAGSEAGRVGSDTTNLAGQIAGEAAVTATADANAAISLSPTSMGVKGGVEAFAGVRAGVDAKLDGTIGGHHLGGVNGGVEVQAGIGFQARAEASYENGKLRVGGKLGASLGIGGAVSGGIEVDVHGIRDAAVDAGRYAADAAVTGARAVGDAAVAGAQAVGSAATAAADAVGNAASAAGTAMADAASAAWDAISFW